MGTSSSGIKRARTDDPSHPEPDVPSSLSAPDLPSPSSDLTTNTASSTTFRNVSACARCRLRKNRCDQNLPACSLCAKAGARCVGFDPITKREIPRTYVYYLESRLTYLETLLTDHGIAFAQSRDFHLGARTIPEQAQGTHTIVATNGNAVPREAFSREDNDEHKLNDLVSNISMASVRGSTDRPYLGTTSGISFARYVAQPRLPSTTDACKGLSSRL